MAITPEQARIELAKRELARRQSSQPIQEQPQTTEESIDQRIANRPSMMASLMEDPTTLQRFAQHPLGTTLRTLGGAAELMQGVGASTALDLQRGQPQNILPNLMKVLQGQRPAEYGDVFRGAGLPEGAAATAGLATDLALSPGGANVMAKVPKGLSAIKGILKWDSALKQAQNSKLALDGLRTTLGQAKQIALQEVKDIPAEIDWSEVPKKALAAINNPIYKVEMDESGKIINTIGNLDKVKTALQDIVTTKDFVEAGKMETRAIMQFAGKVRNAMVKAADDAGKPELGKALEKYHEFMKNYRLINRTLVDNTNTAMANRLKNAFKLKAEPAVKEAWKEVSKVSPEIKATMKSISRGELLKGLLSTKNIVKAGLVGGGAIGVKKLLDD